MSKKILIVEDDMIISLYSKRYLESLGHQVVQSVRSGEAAIKAVKTHRPDVILMDVRLDGAMNGIEAMEEIRKFSNAAVIYTTGNSEPEMKARAEQTSMLAFCTKPVVMDEIRDALSQID